MKLVALAPERRSTASALPSCCGPSARPRRRPTTSIRRCTSRGGRWRRPAPTPRRAPAARRHARPGPGGAWRSTSTRSRRRRPARATGDVRTTTRRSRSTAASCCPRTATRRGRPDGARRWARSTSDCCSSCPRCSPTAGTPAAAIEALEQVVVVDPLHEEAHRALMRLFAAGGRRQQALAQYHLLRESLRRELAAEPDPQTAGLYRALLRGEASPAAGAGARRTRGPRPPGAAPQPADRADELHRPRAGAARGRATARAQPPAHAHRRRAGRARRGSRSRLRRRGSARTPDGVWLVELAGLGDPALVPAATAAALGLTLPSQRPAARRASARSSPRRALLILDNCEHLVAACAVLAERPARAPAPGCGSWRRAASRCASPARSTGAFRRWRCPTRRRSPRRRSCALRGGPAVLRARDATSRRASRSTDGQRRRGGRDLPAPRRHAARARARRRARRRALARADRRAAGRLASPC